MGQNVSANRDGNELFSLVLGLGYRIAYIVGTDSSLRRGFCYSRGELAVFFGFRFRI